MNLFDLAVTIGIKDEVTPQLSQVKATTVAAGQLMADAVKVAGKAAVNLGRQALEGYADTEQLVGGVETLFGAGGQSLEEYAQSVGKSVEAVRKEYNNLITAQEGVMEDAANAFKTAGMSANEYMETVTSFAASLTQSLGGDTMDAAAYANMAITDMADNANKMGSSIESIQNAYQGFAKQNYTMLDNLKLGYGGTKEEMQRLIDDANRVREANGEMADLSIDSFADVVQAIHTMKAAWENLVVGLADENANVDELLDNFLDSVETTAGNILPVVERVLGSIFNLLAENGPEIIAAGARLLGQLAAGAIKAIPEIVASIPTIVMAIVEGFADNGPEFKTIGQDIVRGVWSGIQSLASWIGGKVKGFLGDIVDGAKDLLGIHSPSTVFAGMGENMVLGLEKGWEDNIGQAQRDISKGLDFGTARVEYGASAAGRFGSAVNGGFSGEPITIIVQSVLDGRVIGENSYQYIREKQRAYGW